MASARKRYRAFISYSQRDMTIAQRLHRALENYRVPLGVSPDVIPSKRRLLGKFFRDTEDMSAASDISATVRGAIEDSESLIVVCSPRSAASRWVDTEVQHFRKTGRADRIFAVIIDGAPNSGDSNTECFPPSLRLDAGPDLHPDNMPVEPVGIDLRVDKMERVCARIAAGLLGVPFDQLWRRRRREAMRQWVIRGAIGAAVSAGALALVISLVSGQERRTAAIRSQQLAEAARAAFDVGGVDRAARFALAGLHGADDPLLSFPAEEAEAQLRVALSGRLLSVTRDPFGANPGGADRPYTNLLFSPNGTLLFAGAFSGSAALVEPRTGQVRKRFNLGQGPVQGWFSADGARLAMTAQFGEGSIVDGETGLNPITLENSQSELVAGAFSPDGSLFAAATQAGQAKVWNAATGALVRDLPMPDKLFWAQPAPAAQGQGHDLLVLSHKRVLQRIRLADGAVLSERALGMDLSCAPPHPAHSDLVCTAPLRRPGPARRAIVGPLPHAAYLVAASGARTRLAGCEGHFYSGPAFDRDGASIVASTHDGDVCAWDAKTGARLRIWQPAFNDLGAAIEVSQAASRAVFSPQADVALFVVSESRNTVASVTVSDPDGAMAATLSADGALLAASTADGALLVWDVADQFATDGLPALEGRTASFSMSADRRWAAAAPADQKPLRAWSLSDRTAIDALDKAALAADVVELSPKGDRLVTFGPRGLLRIVDRDRGVTTHSVSTDAKEVLALQAGPGRALAAVALPSGAAAVWSVEDGRRLATITPPVGEITRAILSPDGTRVLTLIAGKDGFTRPGADGPAWVARVHDVASGREVMALKGHRASVVDAAFSPDGATIVTFGDDGAARIWDAASGIERRTVENIGIFGSAPVFSADGRHVAISLQSDEVAVFDLAGRSAVVRLWGHFAAVSSVDFSPSGALLATAGYDETVRLWDTRTGLEVARVAAQIQGVRAARFLDESRLLLGGWQGEMLIAPVPAVATAPRDVLIREACARVFATGGDAFTPEELGAMRILDPVRDGLACDRAGYAARVLRLLGLGR